MIILIRSYHDHKHTLAGLSQLFQNFGQFLQDIHGVSTRTCMVHVGSILKSDNNMAFLKTFELGHKLTRLYCSQIVWSTMDGTSHLAEYPPGRNIMFIKELGLPPDWAIRGRPLSKRSA